MPSERYIPGHPIYGRSVDLPEQPKAEVLRKGLSKFKKAELVELLLELADECPQTWRAIALKCDTAGFGKTMDNKTLVAATRKAIYDATWFDPRQMNTNFRYDHAAYESVAANFNRMIQLKLWQPLLDLLLELMGKVSQQLEMSDEGDMLCEINECLMPSLFNRNRSQCTIVEQLSPIVRSSGWANHPWQKEQLRTIALQSTPPIR